jgi:hypothetical protein
VHQQFSHFRIHQVRLRGHIVAHRLRREDSAWIVSKPEVTIPAANSIEGLEKPANVPPRHHHRPPNIAARFA